MTIRDKARLAKYYARADGQVDAVILLDKVIYDQQPEETAVRVALELYAEYREV